MGCRLLENTHPALCVFAEQEGPGAFPPWFHGLCILSSVQFCFSLAIHARLELLPVCVALVGAEWRAEFNLESSPIPHDQRLHFPPPSIDPLPLVAIGDAVIRTQRAHRSHPPPGWIPFSPSPAQLVGCPNPPFPAIFSWGFTTFRW